MDGVEAKFSAALSRLAPKPKLALAVSGGLDSMALLHLAARENKHQLLVLHFNHQLRGAESDGDEKFVKEQSEALGIPFIPGTANVRESAKGISYEMAARKARHRFFAIMGHLKKADIVLAHHANDQIELFIMRLLRGIEGPGLAGMRPVSPSWGDAQVRLLRPLLDISRKELEGYVRENKIPYREDSSNAELFADRNRIRHLIVPALREEAGDQFERVILDHIAKVSEHLEMKREAARAWLETPRDFRMLPPWLRTEIVATQLDHAGIPVTAARLDALLSSTGAVSIGRNQKISVDGQGRLHLHAEASDVEMDVKIGKTGGLEFGGAQVNWKEVGKADLSAGKSWMVFDADKVGSKIKLRQWRPGDRIKLSGRSSERPLHEMFSRNKIPRAQRHGVIVATTAAGKIFWVEGLRITEEFKVTEATKHFLEWRWSRSQL
jgi:tRNA(Ile)-lysidine synthase